MYRVLKSRPFWWTAWDIVLEKYCSVVKGQRQIMVLSRFNWPFILKYDVCHFKDNFTNQSVSLWGRWLRTT